VIDCVNPLGFDKQGPFALKVDGWNARDAGVRQQGSACWAALPSSTLSANGPCLSKPSGLTQSITILPASASRNDSSSVPWPSHGTRRAPRRPWRPVSMVVGADDVVDPRQLPQLRGRGFRPGRRCASR